MLSQMEQTHVIAPSNIEASICDCHSRLAVLVTHPWGPLGGNMHNNVVVAAVLYFQTLGITTLRFDFKGSQLFGRGHAQVAQVQEAAQFLLDGKHIQQCGDTTNKPPSYILLCGYSYGSLITASASADIPKCIGCIGIAPPVSVQHWLLCFNAKYHQVQSRKRATLPKCFILGSRDNFTSEQDFRELVTSHPLQTTTGAILKGADHFFHKREKDLMSIIGQWLVNTYPACNGDPMLLSKIEYHSFTQVPNLQKDGNGNAAELCGCDALGAACAGP